MHDAVKWSLILSYTIRHRGSSFIGRYAIEVVLSTLPQRFILLQNCDYNAEHNYFGQTA